ncbi:DUF982 domain-containing protein [Mesorhizobium sp. M7A.F.Ca.US.014.04.1.1]|nr:DUF982 domain-containing protein [Mesorhizobium sp. Primo-B]RUU33656.1 DUF982 domain-containing protein [Mesorhizobium sp. Primo-A]RUX46835.1 DUF982 domain-containing protein [Mesorhizobium sp. M7A.F.Ca.US.014.04.1.1]RUY25005.1 DUF982 domain-containing protein [Mesorhizobium sp. M7A.F.Ca.US.001.04.2.1]RUY38626.1 DUF982 domain-containing protein [Mesorhizobium sp. M7A.F.Ca.US.001.04.1.1]RVB85394.1 DUF982 domain-containing protein [Mesorhizobium sp. M7A.F.Ca.AU.002.04.1.1]RVB90187.1 DUF982 d
MSRIPKQVDYAMRVCIAALADEMPTSEFRNAFKVAAKDETTSSYSMSGTSPPANRVVGSP